MSHQRWKNTGKTAFVVKRNRKRKGEENGMSRLAAFHALVVLIVAEKAVRAADMIVPDLIPVAVVFDYYLVSGARVRQLLACARGGGRRPLFVDIDA
jgi:hypothetical protein